MDINILIREVGADIIEMVRTKHYLRRYKYTCWYYCFIGEFARLDGRILVKGMLTGTRKGWGRDKVEMSFHYSASHVLYRLYRVFQKELYNGIPNAAL
jgi:hypothetical protein